MIADREGPSVSRVPGAYITDGTHLFRVVAPFEDGSPDSALLEDCLTLDVLLFTAEELARMPLRPVASA